MSLVITGSPGVGKHTVSKKIAKKYDYKIIDINKIALTLPHNKKRKGTIDIDVEKLKSVFKKKLAKNSLVVGHLAPYVLPKSQAKAVIVLRKSPYKLIPVYKKRKYSQQKMIENLDSEILGIIAYDAIKKFGKKKTYQIDTTKRSISENAKKIESVFDKKFENDYVDWLSLIIKKNDLKKFFSYKRGFEFCLR